MEHVISMEEILGPFWELLPPPAPEPEREQPPVTGIVVGSVIDVAAAGHGDGDMMDQQHATEWTFERLLEEEALTTSTPPPAVVVPNSCCSGALNADRPPVVMEEAVTMAPAAVCSAVVGDPMEYNAILRRKLEEDLEAFKMWRAASSVVTSDQRSQGSNNHTGGSSIRNNPVQNKLMNGEDPINNNHAQTAGGLGVRLATSSSSRDPSPSDEDMDGEVEILGFKMPTEERVRKRKESNRESARRSRYRKAAHLKELEDQVAQLKAENSCLLRRIASLNQKYNDANVDNRVLRADMETLRAKVKMGEDSLKRVIEMSSSAVPSSMPISAPTPSSDAPVPVPVPPPIRDSIVGYFSAPAADDDASVGNGFLRLQAQEPASMVVGATLSATEMNRVAAATHCAGAMELIHTAMGSMPPTSASGSTPPPQDYELLGPNGAIHMDMY
uniref:Opaque-2-1 protein n=3 Tax=Zea mays TaxID=4577 RepID=W5VXD4_MAIZE|nr:opaque-2-1 protein [Zea mays]